MGSEQQPVLIIGGGLGGLCLAQGLQKARIPFHVFERDLHASWRPQGYRLRINGDGASALKRSLPEVLFERFERTCCEVELGETDLNALDGGILACRRGGGPLNAGMKTYTADRKVLRDLLLTGLDQHISFGKEFIRYELTETGVVARFRDGTQAEGCLLVGADGSRSVTRKQFLPGHVPLDTNGCCIYGKTTITAELQEQFPVAAMRWMTLVVDRTPITQTLDVDETPVTLLLEPIRFPKNEYQDELPADYVYWVLIAKKEIFNLPEGSLSHVTGEEAAVMSLRITDCWDPQIRSLLHLQDKTQSSLLRVLSTSPEIELWAPSARVTVIGDAIHPMSPCGGVGAVTALVDGANLAEIIATKGISEEAIGEFEGKMREFAGKSIQRSFIGGRKLFGQKPFEQCKPYQN